MVFERSTNPRQGIADEHIDHAGASDGGSQQDEPLRFVRDLDDRDRIVTELADGEFEADVVNLKQLELFD